MSRLFFFLSLLYLSVSLPSTNAISLTHLIRTRGRIHSNPGCGGFGALFMNCGGGGGGGGGHTSESYQRNHHIIPTQHNTPHHTTHHITSSLGLGCLCFIVLMCYNFLVFVDVMWCDVSVMWCFCDVMYDVMFLWCFSYVSVMFQFQWCDVSVMFVWCGCSGNQVRWS